MAATSAGHPLAGCGDVTIKHQQQQQQQQSSIIVSQAMPGTIVSALVSSSHQVSQQPLPPTTHMQRPSSFMQQRMPNSSSSASSSSSSTATSSSSHLHQQQQQQFIDNNFTNTGAVTCQNSSLSNSYSEQNCNNNKNSVENGSSRNSSQNNVIVNYNLAPSWKRLIHNGEIVYVSPSDATLRDIMQVKQYLLSTGTCKCGLPCPIRPESFFDFNIENPTVQMSPSVTDSINSSCCSHRRNAETTSQDSGNSRDSSIVPPERKIKVTQNILLTPGMQDGKLMEPVNGRVPPLHSSGIWNGEDSTTAKPSFVNNKGKVVKKRPTFKDDPTGYLNHQTAILHSSISTIYSDAKEQQDEDEIRPKTFVQQPQQQQQPPYPSQRIRDVPENREPVKDVETRAPPTVQMCNGVMQVHQNCDMRHIKQQIQHQIEQRNLLIKQNQQLARIRTASKQNDVDNSKSYVFVQSPIESPVSSSTAAMNRSTPENRSASSTPDSKGPLQATNVTTSNNDSNSLSSASPSPEYISPANGTTFAVKRKVDSLQDQKNIVTSVVAGRNITTTTNTGIISDGGIFTPNGTIVYKRPAAPKQVMPQTMIQNCVPAQQQLNLQTLQRNEQGQFIITPNSQVVMMPGGATAQKNGTMISTGNSNIGQFVGGNIVTIGNNEQQMLQSPNSGVIIQNSPQQGYIQSSNNIITNNNPNFVGNLQQMILNNGTNIIHSPNGQNILSSPNATNMLQTVPAASPKMIQSAGNTVQVIQNSSSNMGQQIITQNGQTVVLNQLPNGMIVQQPVDGQIVNRLIQDGTGMMLSPDSKRKTKKRKGTITPQGMSPQGVQLSPTIQQSSPHTAATQSPQTSSMLHVNAISPQYQNQNFQLSPGLSGLTIVPKTQTTSATQPQQQILVQNGQTVIQPLGLLGQQLLVPAGLVITPDNNLVQIQSIGQMGNIITPQGMVIRAQSPQQKQFLSPSTGQQYIVSNNGQVSPMGQIYGGSVGLVQVPQSNATNGQNAGILQQNIVQQQHNHAATSQGNATAIINSQGQFIASAAGQQHTTGIMTTTTTTTNSMKDFLNAGHSVSTQTAQQQLLLQSSPPDTTTHSPQSPERPSSARSGASYEGMAMVQCVSSSEPDSVVSPTNIDASQLNMQSNHIEYIEQKSGQVVQYLTSSSTSFKPSDPKIKRIQMNARRNNYYMSPVTNFTSQHFDKNLTTTTSSSDDVFNSRPDSHESSSNSPTQSSMSPETKKSAYRPAINELVWGPARGYPAWPGKIVVGPEGVTTPVDCVWIRWFGGRANIEMTSVNGLKTLSEGLEAHHSALKDTRKSRKLNSQLERAIQEAMAELDQTSAKTTNLGKNTKKSTSHLGKGGRNRTTSALNNNNQRKPVKIAPAPTASNIK